MMLGVGVIGCGLIGQKRAKALGAGGRLVASADIDLKRAQALAGSGAKAFSDWRDLLALWKLKWSLLPRYTIRWPRSPWQR